MQTFGGTNKQHYDIFESGLLQYIVFFKVIVGRFFFSFRNFIKITKTMPMTAHLIKLLIRLLSKTHSLKYIWKSR